MNSSLLLMAALAASLNPNCPYVCINSTVAQLTKAAIDSLSKDIEAAKGGK